MNTTIELICEDCDVNIDYCACDQACNKCDKIHPFSECEEEEEEEEYCIGKHCSNTDDLKKGKCWNRFAQAVTVELICNECWSEETYKKCNGGCAEIKLWTELKIMPDHFPWGKDETDYNRAHCEECIKFIKQYASTASEDDWA